MPTGTVAVEKDEEVVRDASPATTLNDVVATIKVQTCPCEYNHKFYLLMSTKKYDKNKKVNMELMINESYIMTIYTCMFDICMKHLAQQMENIENQNKKRLNAIDKTNTSMLKAIYTLAKQDYKDSMKDGDEDVAMSGTHDNTSVYREPYIVKMRIRGCPTRL